MCTIPAHICQYKKNNFVNNTKHQKLLVYVCNYLLKIECGFSKKLRSKVMAWKSQYANEFELTANSFRALPRSTKHGNYLIDNW